MALIIILSILVVTGITGILFVNLSPEFGGTHTKEDKERYRASGHYTDGKFENAVETSMDMGFVGIVKTLYEFTVGGEDRRPAKPLPIQTHSAEELADYSGAPRLTWFGHSAFLLQADGANILIDPMFGQVPAPHPWLGSNRFNDQLPVSMDDLPPIDFILLSHDHYDHLDYGSIVKLKSKTGKYFVPLGVGAHLEAWGISSQDIVEMNWWEEKNFNGFDLALTPARHFSGRGPTNRFSTLWGSWVIKGKGTNLFFSGDSGYGPHFKEIGQKYGPFEFAMLECGQYNERWEEIHMLPEQTVQAARDIGAEVMMPIHWGAFTLALHTWYDPALRVREEAENEKVRIITPMIGEWVYLNKLTPENGDWWKSLVSN